MLVFLHQVDHTHKPDSVEDAVSCLMLMEPHRSHTGLDYFKTRMSHSMFGAKTLTIIYYSMP